MGFVIEYLEEIPSTQSYLLEIVERRELPFGYTVFTRLQGSGRGRRGRSFWMSPTGGLPFSSWFPLELPPKDLLWIPLLAGVVLGEVLSRWAKIYLRWPNDLVSFSGGKVAGILSESVFSGSKLRGVVVGIGINLFFDQGEPPHELSGIALSLEELPLPEEGPSADERRTWLRGMGVEGRRALIEEWLSGMHSALEDFRHPSGRRELFARYHRFFRPELRRIRFRLGAEERIGYIIRIQPEGSLRVRDLKEGREYTIQPEALLDEDLPSGS